MASISAAIRTLIDAFIEWWQSHALWKLVQNAPKVEAFPIRERSIRDPTGVVLESVCELLDSIELKQSLERMQEILKSIASALTDLSSVDMKLDLPTDDIHKFLSVVSESRLLISASLREGRVVPAQKMKKLEDSMLKFYLVDMRHLVVAKIMSLQLDPQPSNVDTAIPNLNRSQELGSSSPDGLGKLISSSHHNQSREQFPSSLGGIGKSFLQDDRFGVAADVPPVSLKEKFQGIVVGPCHPVVELKGLIQDRKSPLVISAPPGHGKTTLARKFCEDAAIKDKYGDCIIFLHVSATPNVAAIIYKLCEYINYSQSGKIPSGTYEIREVEKIIKTLGIKDMLLVLDDVWRGSEFLIDEFNLQIPGYKLLVTSRFRFPKFDGYELTRLCQNDGQPLYFQSAKCHPDQNNHHFYKGDGLSHVLPVLVWEIILKKYATEDEPNYIENQEAMKKTIALVDMFETEDIDAYVLPFDYLHSRIFRE